MGLSDFTEVADLGVSIAGEPLDLASITSGCPFPASSTPTWCSAEKA
jgi:hypothetical protein